MLGRIVVITGSSRRPRASAREAALPDRLRARCASSDRARARSRIGEDIAMADRVLVLSARPATVRALHVVELPRGRPRPGSIAHRPAVSGVLCEDLGRSREAGQRPMRAGSPNWRKQSTYSSLRLQAWRPPVALSMSAKLVAVSNHAAGSAATASTPGLRLSSGTPSALRSPMWRHPGIGKSGCSAHRPGVDRRGGAGRAIMGPRHDGVGSVPATIDNPFGTRLSPMSWVRPVTYVFGLDNAAAGGEGGIRTPDRLAPMPHFECGAFNHSATSPEGAI